MPRTRSANRSAAAVPAKCATACRAFAESTRTCLQVASASSKSALPAASAFALNASASSLRIFVVRPRAVPLDAAEAVASSTRAWATKSRRVGPRPPSLGVSEPLLTIGITLPSSASPTPRSSSNFSKASGSATAWAMQRAVLRLRKLPTAKLVLTVLCKRSEVRRAWQHEATRSEERRRSVSSRAWPRIRAPHLSFAALSGTTLRTQRYRSASPSCCSSVTWTSSCRICSTASCCSVAAAFRAKTASACKQSGKSSKSLKICPSCSGGGNLLKAMANNWEDFSSRILKRFLVSSVTIGRLAVAPDPDAGARGCERAN
mmetsp:Transcript_33760/g.110401  ORF Transcript_33760/g.110401 Transcript_33760/m.110401 type:complete len:318 (+) Transcript_33760:1069-2022(+)